MNNVGRPIEYSEAIILKTQEYIDACIDEIDEFHKTRGDKSDSYERIIQVKLPSIEGLSVYLKVSRDTIYDWENKYKEFSYILGELRALQAERLINSGLNGDYNPIIAKLLLMKHGYKDRSDMTTDDKPITVVFDSAFNETASKTKTNSQ